MVGEGAIGRIKGELVGKMIVFPTQNFVLLFGTSEGESGFGSKYLNLICII